ncbi:MAG: hypothetical protein U5K27_10355 [Desulfotignum sp.]|nr:hypothetical protein [Desulfotignum sp.]
MALVEACSAALDMNRVLELQFLCCCAETLFDFSEVCSAPADASM